MNEEKKEGKKEKINKQRQKEVSQDGKQEGRNGGTDLIKGRLTEENKIETDRHTDGQTETRQKDRMTEKKK